MAVTALTRTRTVAPGPRGLSLLRVARGLRREPLPMFQHLFEQYGDMVHMSLSPERYNVLFHPRAAEHVLAHNHKNYRKGIINAQFRVLDGEGLVVSEGSFWARQRRLAQPAFHRERLAQLGGVMAKVAGETADRWRSYAQEGRLFDIEPEMMRLTLRVAGLTLFSVDTSGDADTVRPAVDVARTYIGFRMNNPYLPHAFPTPQRLQFARAKATLDRLVYGIIRERRRTREDPGDLLSMFLAARDEETGEGMSDRQLRDEVMTMLMAGHESSAVALTWVWRLLAEHPQAQQKLHAELDKVLAGRDATVEDLPRLPYTRMVIDEALRLYPPAWGLARQAIGEDEIEGYRIHRGSMVVMVQYVAHRHPGVWDDPEAFRPERFAPGLGEDRPRFAAFPFGVGPRRCIGLHFSMMEMQLAVATLAQRYRMTMAPGQTLKLEALLSLRPIGGVKVTLEERSG
jgi:cytochrome P450